MDPQRDPEGVESEHLYKVGFSREDRALEIGTGNGRLTWRLLPLVDSVVGIEIDGQALRQAEAVRTERRIQDAAFMESSAEQLPLAAGSFEWVILAWSL